LARIVLACWGSYGDLFPYVGLALELRALGHVPVVATCPIYRDIVEGESLAFHPVRPDVDPTSSDLIARVMDPARGPEVVVRELIVPFVRDAYEDLSKAIDGADFLLSHPVTMAAPLVGEKRGIPWMSSVLAPTSFFSRTDFPVAGPMPGPIKALRRTRWGAGLLTRIVRHATRDWTTPVQDFRRDLGLPPAGNALLEGQFSPRGTLAMFSSVMAAPQADWPPHTHLTGFSFYGGRVKALPDDVARFLDSGDPPIVFTLGSSAVGAPGSFYEESVAAARAIGRRAILLVGQYATTRPQVPGSMLVAEYAPHAELFPRAAAIVHHGGVGTTGQGLASGRPMLVVPHSHDQPDNADRCVRLGVSQTIDAREYRAPRVANALRALLERPAYASRAGDVAAIVRQEHGARAAADVIAGEIDRGDRRR
jgi:rhamnosyltransferase subunit B